jgi:hypothetical protein
LQKIRCFKRGAFVCIARRQSNIPYATGLRQSGVSLPITEWKKSRRRAAAPWYRHTEYAAEPEARPHGLLKSNRSGLAAGSVGGVLSRSPRPTLARLLLELVSLAGASRGSHSIRDGRTAEVPANGRLVRRDAEVTTSLLLSSYVAGENRQARLKADRCRQPSPPLAAWSLVFLAWLNAALPFHSIKKGAEREWAFCTWSFDAAQLQIAKQGIPKESAGSLRRGGCVSDSSCEVPRAESLSVSIESDATRSWRIAIA